MTAVTQCPQCGTRFRVVPDQLKISHGWVRCGKCAEVFNAREALEMAAALKAGQPGPLPSAHAGVAPQQVSIVLRQQASASPEPTSPEPILPPEPAPQPQPQQEPQPEPEPVPLPAPVSPPGDAVAAQPKVPEPEPVNPLDVAPALPAWLVKPVAAQASVSVRPTVEAAQAEEPAALQTEAMSVLQQTVAHWVRAHVPGPDPEFAVSAHETHDLVSAPPAPEPPGDAQAEVGFIRQARRKAAWVSAPVRVALGVLVVLAGALLALQVLVHERNRWVAMAPSLKPLLMQLCEPIGCEVGPYLRIEAVEIVSTELIRAKDGTYRFELSLRNNAALPVAMPAVELSLTDRSSEAVVRRVVLPDDWVEAPSELMSHSETGLTLKMSLVNLDELRMEGFRAVVFYP